MEGHGRTPRGNRVSGWVVAQTCPPVCIRPDQSFGPDSTSTLLDHDRQKTTDSVEKVALAAASRSDVPAVEVAASHFKLPSGVSLSVLAQV